ncbi:MAG: radical SAM protein [Candidatus Omnitrophica bacterium]|nr:radical SAM protein [Candidatus Omnitrophota bacterium]
MHKNSFHYLYGPVYSWRLGMSLGVDPISQSEKVCNFNCIYCQLGVACAAQLKRKEFVSTHAIIDEINKVSAPNIDYITFSGKGEPTLAKNLGEMIKAVKAVRPEKIAVITNSSLLGCADVRTDLMPADFVLAKLDACCAKGFEKINQGGKEISFEGIVQGLCAFRKAFKGKFALQIMFVEQNKGDAKGMAELVKKINPDEIQLNTPLRLCAVKPLTEQQMKDIKKEFVHFKTISVYEIPKKSYRPFDDEKTASRHGKLKK